MALIPVRIFYALIADYLIRLIGQKQQTDWEWAEGTSRTDVQLSRKRILLIFLMIRYTGAKLKEVLALNPFWDIKLNRQSIVFGKLDATPDRLVREIQIPEALSQEIQVALADAAVKKFLGGLFNVDPGHIRRKF